jgi:lysozyme
VTPFTEPGELTSPARQQFDHTPTPAPAPGPETGAAAAISYGIDSYERDPWFLDGTVTFVILKALELGFREDTMFATRYPLVRKNNRLRGAYCFGHPSQDAVKGAQWFARILKANGWDKRDRVWLDHEVADGKSPAYCAKWAADFCGTLDTEVGLLHGGTGIYSFLDFIRGGYCAGLGDRPLWLAHPQKAGTPPPTDLGPWTASDVALLQYTSTSVDWDCTLLSGAALTGWWEKYAQGPTRHSADGKASLAGVCERAGKPLADAIWLTCVKHPDGLGPLQRRYLGAGNMSNPMPAGMTYWQP